MMNETELYKKAITQWGVESQLRMMIEECAELVNALCKLPRKRADGFDVITEIADVEIMIGQLRLIFGNEKVDAEKENKLERLQKRLVLSVIKDEKKGQIFRNMALYTNEGAVIKHFGKWNEEEPFGKNLYNFILWVDDNDKWSELSEYINNITEEK